MMTLFLVLALLVPILAACGDDETPTATTSEATKTTEPTKTVEPTKTAEPPTTTEVPFVNDPVKIAVIQDWSGPMAIAGLLTEGPMELLRWWYNEKQGGLLLKKEGVRRPIEFVKCDMKSQTADANGCALKMILDEKVSVLTMGGWTEAHALATADVGEKYKVLYVGAFVGPVLTEDHRWTLDVRGLRAPPTIAFVKKLQPKTVGYFATDAAGERGYIAEIKKNLEGAGIKTVYEQYYTQGTNDFSPYLTRIKYEAPDVLVTSADPAAYQAMYKQIMEQGGWGDIKCVAVMENGSAPNLVTRPGAVGTYAPLRYLYGHGGAGARTFEEMWAQKCKEDPAWCQKWAAGKSMPTPTASFSDIMFNSFLVAVKAVEHAGTSDPAAVAEAARSGDFVVDSPFGQLAFDTKGVALAPGFYVQVQAGGVLVPVE